MNKSALLALVMLVGCGHAHDATGPAPTHSTATDGTVTLTGASRDYVRVEAAAAAPAVARRSLLARVAFDDRHTAIVGAPVSGRVTAVTVVTGSVVRRGDPLLTIHSADIAAARAGLTEARQSRMLAEETAARAALLVRQGAGTEAEQQQADTALAEARSAEQGQTEALGALGAQASEVDYVLRAPIAGTVVERSVQVGNAVGADQTSPLCTIADLSTVWILVDVYEHDLAYVHATDAAHVVIPGLDDRTYDGTVAYVGQVVDAATRAARARIELTNADGALRPGMFAQVEVASADSATAYVPTSAVLARRDEFFVFVQSGPDAFRQREVRLGVEEDDHIAILEGLTAGEQVVTRGAILLDAEANAAF